MRIACIHVAAFPLAAWLRTDPELRGAAVVVIDAPGPRARIVACAPEAAQRGVAVGMTAAQAVAIASDLTVRAASPAAEHAAQAALCDVAYSCSPRVEERGLGTVYCDVDGLHGLYASEAELARAIVGRARGLGLAASVGLAASKIAAQLAARDGGGCAVIPPHEEWRFLAPLPIHLLAPDVALQQTLARWGIRTLGDLAALPASAVATRLGPAGAQLARRARGEDEHPLAPRPLPLHFEETAELDHGVDSLEPFLFVVRGLLDRLIARLALRG
jgi:protein ImuB